MADKTFYAHIKRDDKVVQPVHATGFNGGRQTFVSFKLGGTVMDVGLLINPDEARAIAQALLDAADFAQPREVSSADLGLGEAA